MKTIVKLILKVVLPLLPLLAILGLIDFEKASEMLDAVVGNAD